MSIVVGSYGTATRPLTSPAEFDLLTTGVLDIDEVDGLEVPYFGPDSPWQEPGLLSRDGARHVLTTVPAMMAAIGSDPAFGLASVDPDSRHAAVEVVRAARDFVERVDGAGGARFETVQLHSAPGRHLSSADAFARSIEEIASWDWAGASLAIEHCDAVARDHEPEKGFLPLADELQIAAAHGIGVVVNWGRSAIETRDADGPAAHIAAVVVADALSGLVFSGCADAENAYGRPFEDRHVPIRDWGVGQLSDAAGSSLLTRAEVQRCVDLALQAPELRFLGVKVKAPPIATPEQWLDVIAGNLRVLTGALDGRRAASA